MSRRSLRGSRPSRAPQRSRRLSASGILQGYSPACPKPSPITRPSKKQTPFSVWYSRLRPAERNRDVVPSKKQTPFSVWYTIGRGAFPIAVCPSKKQTPFSVWYHLVSAPYRGRVAPLKEADAFQRLV